ncbi:MAG: AI-2E family transporter [Burkholderiales bacterium]
MIQDRAVIQPPGDSEPAVPPLVLQAPLDVRSTALAVLALLAVIGFLFVARAVFIPITVAVLTSYALTPVLDWLKRRGRLPKPVGAGVTLAVILMGLFAGLNSLQPQAIQVLDIVPRATAKFRAALQRDPRDPPSAVEKIKDAAREIGNAANAAAETATAPAQSQASAAIKPSPDASPIEVRDYVLMGTANAIAGFGQLIVVVALVYFILIAGDSFRRTMVRISGDTLSKKKITVQILDEINSQIQRYLLVQVATSALLGVLTWMVFTSMGLANPLFWAFFGGVLHLIPYAGPTLLIFSVGLVAYVQFDTLQPVVLITGLTLVINGVIGLLLVPWLTQRVGRLNAVTVFITLLFWGWLWGIWGLLLGVPIVMAINAVCERVEDLQPISEFLGYAPKKQTNEASPSAPGP